MPKSSAKPTTAGNLEAKFDAGEDVLDYFDLRAAKVMPPLKEAAAKPGRRATTTQRQPAGRLKRAREIASQIERLGNELRFLLGARNV